MSKYLLFFFLLCSIYTFSDDTEAIDSLIKKLGSSDFEIRDAAKEKLKERVFEAYEFLRVASTNNDLEVASAAEEILATLGKYDTPELKGIPLSSIEKPKSVDEYNKNIIQFIATIGLKQYDEIGLKNNWWDEEAKQFIAQMSVYIIDPSLCDFDQLKLLSSGLVEKNCTDPLIYYFLGEYYRQADHPFLSSKYFGLFQKSYGKYKGSSVFKYLYEFNTFYISRRTSNYYHYVKKAKEFLIDCYDQFKIDDVSRRFYYEQMSNVLEWSKFKEKNEIFTVFETKDRGSWLTAMILGYFHLKLRSYYYQSGIDRAKDADPALGKKHSDLALECFAEAHSKKPHLPNAAVEMMKLSRWGGNRKDFRPWFDKAVAAEIDNPIAHHELVIGMSYLGTIDDRKALAFELLLLSKKYGNLGRSAYEEYEFIYRKSANWLTAMNEVGLKGPIYLSLTNLLKRLKAGKLREKYLNIFAIMAWLQKDMVKHVEIRKELKDLNRNFASTKRHGWFVETGPINADYQYFTKFSHTKIFKLLADKEAFRQEDFLSVFSELPDSKKIDFLFHCGNELPKLFDKDLSKFLDKFEEFGFIEMPIMLYQKACSLKIGINSQLLEWYKGKYSLSALKAINAIGSFNAGSYKQRDDLLAVIDQIYLNGELASGDEEEYLWMKLRAVSRPISYMSNLKSIDGLLSSVFAKIKDNGRLVDFITTQAQYNEFDQSRDSLVWLAHHHVFSKIELNFSRNQDLLAEANKLVMEKPKEYISFILKNGNPSLLLSLSSWGDDSEKNFAYYRTFQLSERYYHFLEQATSMGVNTLTAINWVHFNTTGWKLQRNIYADILYRKRGDLPEFALLKAEKDLEDNDFVALKKNLVIGIKKPGDKGPYFYNQNKYDSYELFFAAIKASLLEKSIKNVEMHEFIKVLELPASESSE